MTLHVSKSIELNTTNNKFYFCKLKDNEDVGWHGEGRLEIELKP